MTSTLVQILDACVLINLLAGGEIEGVLGAAARESLICSAMEKESIYLRTDDPHAPLELIRLDPLIDSELLTVCHVEGDEEAQLYIDYASKLDDGEAMSLAIALSRGYDLATDERKARRSGRRHAVGRGQARPPPEPGRTSGPRTRRGPARGSPRRRAVDGPEGGALDRRAHRAERPRDDRLESHAPPRLHAASPAPASPPELNPTERLSPLVKEGVANRAHDTLAALEREVCGRCQRITAAQVAALTNYHWWPAA